MAVLVALVVFGGLGLASATDNHNGGCPPSNGGGQPGDDQGTVGTVIVPVQIPIQINCQDQCNLQNNCQTQTSNNANSNNNCNMNCVNVVPCAPVDPGCTISGNSVNFNCNNAGANSCNNICATGGSNCVMNSIMLPIAISNCNPINIVNTNQQQQQQKQKQKQQQKQKQKQKQKKTGTS